MELKWEAKPEEGVRVHHVVHYVDPSFQTDDLENGDPRISNIVERNGSLEGILRATLAASVVPVPVDALVAAVDAVFRVEAGDSVPEFGAARAFLPARVSVSFEEAGGAAEQALAAVGRTNHCFFVVLAVVRVELQLRFVAGKAFSRVANFEKNK